MSFIMIIIMIINSRRGWCDTYRTDMPCHPYYAVGTILDHRKACRRLNMGSISYAGVEGIRMQIRTYI
jgi:hypothetical protein